MLLTASAGTFYSPVVNNFSTTLTTNIDASTSTITVASTSGLPSSGVVSIGNEVVYYTGKTSYVLTGCSRGYDGTTAATHSSGDDAELRWIAAHFNSLTGEVLRIEQVLGASVSGNTTSVDARISGYDDYTAATFVSPTSPRLGAKFYASTPQQWYVYNGSTWDLLDIGSEPVAIKSHHMSIDSPIEDKISNFSAVSPGTYGMTNIAVAAAGVEGVCTLSLNRLEDDQLVASYTQVAAYTVTIVADLSETLEFVGTGKTSPPGAITTYTSAVYTPSIGESGTVSAYARTYDGWTRAWVTDSVTAAPTWSTTAYDSYATYTYSKTDTTTINLTLLSTSGIYAHAYLQPVFEWDLVNSSGVIWSSWSAISSNWPDFDPGLSPYAGPYPNYFPGGWFVNNNIALYSTITTGSGEEKISVANFAFDPNEDANSISGGDVIFTKVDSISGTISRVTTTVDIRGL
jgi:hypothetical protein